MALTSLSLQGTPGYASGGFAAHDTLAVTRKNRGGGGGIVVFEEPEQKRPRWIEDEEALVLQLLLG